MYTIHRTDEYLQHHGIRGQKWGQRNGPPYPLNESDRSSKEQRLNSKSKSSSKEDSEEKHKGLTDAQKRAIMIGAAVTGTALVAIGGYSLYKSNLVPSLVSTGRKYTGIKNFKTKASELSKIEDIKAVNPNFGKKTFFDKAGRKWADNCTYCSATYELRRRGFDVTAKPLIGGTDIENFGKWFKNLELLNSGTERLPNEDDAKFAKRCYDKLCKNILEECESGNGRGVVGIHVNEMFGGGGHAFSWEAKDGIISFIDSQRNNIDASQYFFDHKFEPDTLAYARLDHLELKEGVKEVCKNASRNYFQKLFQKRKN